MVASAPPVVDPHSSWFRFAPCCVVTPHSRVCCPESHPEWLCTRDVYSVRYRDVVAKWRITMLRYLALAPIFDDRCIPADRSGTEANS